MVCTQIFCFVLFGFITFGLCAYVFSWYVKTYFRIGLVFLLVDFVNCFCQRLKCLKSVCFCSFSGHYFTHLEWIRTRKTPNTDTLQAVFFVSWFILICFRLLTANTWCVWLTTLSNRLKYVSNCFSLSFVWVLAWVLLCFGSLLCLT